MPDVSERSFEEAIECGLLQHGPDACAGDTVVRETLAPYGDTVPGGYRKRAPEDYDRALCPPTGPTGGCSRRSRTTRATTRMNGFSEKQTAKTFG